MVDFRVWWCVFFKEGEVVEMMIGVEFEVIFEIEPITRVVLDVVFEDFE